MAQCPRRLRARRALIVGAALALAVGAPAAAGSLADPADDFLPGCDLAAAPQPGVSEMDIVEGRYLGTAGGFERFELVTRGDVSAYFSSGPPSAAFVVTLAPQPGGPTYELTREIHEGMRRSVVERDGEAVPGTELLVDAGEGGRPIFQVSGLPTLGDASRWGATAFVTPAGSAFECDRFGLDPAGAPVLAVRGGPSPPAAPPPGDATDERAKPTGPPPERAGTPPERAEDQADGGVPWWWALVFALGGLGLALLLLVMFRDWRPWGTASARRRAEASASHPAPPIPPPGDNEFGGSPNELAVCEELQRRCDLFRRACLDADGKARMASERKATAEGVFLAMPRDSEAEEAFMAAAREAAEAQEAARRMCAEADDVCRAARECRERLGR